MEEKSTVSFNIFMEKVIKSFPKLIEMIQDELGKDVIFSEPEFSNSYRGFYINSESVKFSGEKLGLVKYGMKDLKFSITGMGQTIDDDIALSTVWFRVSLSYNHPGGGRNSTDAYTQSEKRMQYDFDFETETYKLI